MSKQIFKKWWVILIQGILLVAVSFFIFSNPEEVLAGISMWFGIVVLLIGLLGVIGWLMQDEEERKKTSVIWSLLTAFIGLMMLLKLGATMKTISTLFGLWVLSSGILLLKDGWSLKEQGTLGKLLLVVGILSVIAAFMMIFDMGTGAIAIGTLLGIQVLITGIALILIAFAKKAIVGHLKS